MSFIVDRAHAALGIEFVMTESYDEDGQYTIRIWEKFGAEKERQRKLYEFKGDGALKDGAYEFAQLCHEYGLDRA